MQKIFTITSVVALAIIIAFACKKSTTTSKSGTTGSGTSTPTVTSLTVDGTPLSNVTGRDTLLTSNSIIEAYPASGFPYIKIWFTGNITPISGTYSLTNAALPTTAGQCSFFLYTSTDYYLGFPGTIYINNAGSPNNTATFSNIICHGITTHTVSGTIKY